MIGNGIYEGVSSNKLKNIRCNISIAGILSTVVE